MKKTLRELRAVLFRANPFALRCRFCGKRPSVFAEYRTSIDGLIADDYVLYDVSYNGLVRRFTCAGCK